MTIVIRAAVLHGYGDHFVMMYVCVYMYVLAQQIKTPDRKDSKLDTLVVLSSLLEPIDFGFKRSGAPGTLACVFSDFCQTHNDKPLPLPVYIYTATFPFKSL